jgi:DNA-binding NarL/FixJ family response regulator
MEKNKPFTKKQIEILNLLLKGNRQKTISVKLKVSEKTIAEQIRRMKEKAKISKRFNLYTFVIKAATHHSVTKVYTYK